MKKVKVLYIIGWGRSGTTLLANILGQLPGWFSAGELGTVWEFSLQGKARCGCKSHFRECNVWNDIFNEAFGGYDNIDITEMQDITHNETRSLRLPWFFLNGGRCRNFPRREKYLATLEALYSGIARSTKCHIIVDSSKAPVYAGALRLIPGLDLYLVHIIRDPRAVAFSLLTPKENQELKETLEYRNPFDNALNWNAGNLAAEYLGIIQKDKYLRIKYEDFIAQPRKHLTRILEMVGETSKETPLVDGNKVAIQPTHSVRGNPGRFDTGIIELKTDLRWKSNLPITIKILSTLLTFPLMLRYGYKINE